MKIHHDVDNLNKALEGHDDLLKMHGRQLLTNLWEEAQKRLKDANA